MTPLEPWKVGEGAFRDHFVGVNFNTFTPTFVAINFHFRPYHSAASKRENGVNSVIREQRVHDVIDICLDRLKSGPAGRLADRAPAYMGYSTRRLVNPHRLDCICSHSVSRK